MKAVRKKTLPVNEIRRFLEPGPIVLVSSGYVASRETTVKSCAAASLSGSAASPIRLNLQVRHSTSLQGGKRCCAQQFPNVGSQRRGYSSLLLLVRCLRNNRISSGHFLDQHCALSDDFEPMLLARKH
jgi:hypothetical protein